MDSQIITPTTPGNFAQKLKAYIRKRNNDPVKRVDVAVANYRLEAQKERERLARGGRRHG